MSNISLTDFNSHFMTYIKGFENSHTDETGTYLYGVGFNVVCKDNNRVMYFESHVTSNMVPTNPNENDVVTAAWSNVLPNVKTWTSSVISSSNLIGNNFTPSVASDSNLNFITPSNYTYETYNSNYDTRISRMEPYPDNNPRSWCVGFACTSKNSPSTFLSIDTQVVVNTFAIYRAEQEILDMGWSNLKETIGRWAQEHDSQSQLLNSVYTTSNW